MTKRGHRKRKNRPRSRSRAAYLAEVFGGKWKYDGVTTWRCDDGRRRVSRVSAGVDEFDNEVSPPHYYLYGDGVPHRVRWSKKWDQKERHEDR